MKVRYTSTAFVEITEILSHVAGYDRAAAERLSLAILQSINLISRHPEIAPVVHPDGVRAKMVARYRYRIFYAIDENEIIVRNVRSTHRTPPWDSQEG